MGVTVKVDLRGVQHKISAQNIKRGQYALANQALADMMPFVPKKEGTLRQSGYVTSVNSIVFNTPYAKRQFYLKGRKYSTPGTGPRWDLKAKSMYMPKWRKAFIKGAGIT